MFFQIEDTTFNSDFVKRVYVSTAKGINNTAVSIMVVDTDDVTYIFKSVKIENTKKEAIESQIFTYNDFIYKILQSRRCYA